MPEAVSGAGGHGATFRVACILWQGFALNHDEVMELLREYNHRCSPPWSERELQHKANEAAKAPHQRERGYLLESTQQTEQKRHRQIKHLPSGAGKMWGTFAPLREGEIHEQSTMKAPENRESS